MATKWLYVTMSEFNVLIAKKMTVPRLLMIAPNALLPLDMASKVRIFNILKASVENFEVTFLSRCDRNDAFNNDEFLKEIGVNHTLFMPSRNKVNLGSRYFYGALSILTKYLFGIPPQLFYSGFINLSLKRVAESIKNKQFDVVLYEYWFSSLSVNLFKNLMIPCVLDMHDILWRKLSTSDESCSFNHPPEKNINFYARRYRKFEERSWRRFDHLIAINYKEALYVREKIQSNVSIITAGMGVDLNKWPYCWKPASPSRVVFYGSLSGKENEIAALRCANRIMPLIWSRVPNAELWLVGANPSKSLRKLETNPRIKLTGFIDNVQGALSKAAVMLCPLKGQYGFRSRLIEAMALGVPLSVTSDAIYGMGLKDGEGLHVHDNDLDIANAVVKLITDTNFAFAQSVLARNQVEKRFSFEETYGQIASYLLSCAKSHKTLLR